MIESNEVMKTLLLTFFIDPSLGTPVLKQCQGFFFLFVFFFSFQFVCTYYNYMITYIFLLERNWHVRKSTYKCMSTHSTKVQTWVKILQTIQLGATTLVLRNKLFSRLDGYTDMIFRAGQSYKCVKVVAWDTPIL